MPLEELEKQLLSLSPIDQLRIVQSVIQSLIPNSTLEPSQNAENLNHDRSLDHSLRNLPLTVPSDFDQPLALVAS